MQTDHSYSTIRSLALYLWKCIILFAIDEHRPVKKSRKIFGKLIHYFIIGGDSCFMVQHNGDCNIIGCEDKIKHENNSPDSRSLVTVYCIRSIIGDTGPMVILLVWAKISQQWGNMVIFYFVKTHDDAKGSSIIMMDTDLVNTYTWVELTLKLLL